MDTSIPTLTRADIAQRINVKMKLSKPQASNLVEHVLESLIEAFQEGENVKVPLFGTFMLRKKAKRVGRNPKTGEEAVITPRTVLTFRASRHLKSEILGKDGASK